MADNNNQEIYHSSTMGDIPLSFTGRHLLQSLREAIVERDAKILRRHSNGQTPLINSNDWPALSEARGRIAKYMSELESARHIHPRWQPNFPELLKAASDEELLNEVERRLCRRAGLAYPLNPSKNQD